MPRRIKISLATKFSVAFAALFLVIMLLIVNEVRGIIEEQFTAEYERQVRSTLNSIQLDLETQQKTLKQQVGQFAKKILDDNDFRLHALVLQDVSNPFLIDYARTYMPAMGLQVLEIVNQNGTVLSSGHARNSFGKQIGPLLRKLQSFDAGCGLAWFQEPDRTFLCLTVLESVKLGNQRFYLVGGTEITPSFLTDLQQDSSDILHLQLPRSGISSAPERVSEILAKIEPGENHHNSVVEFEKQYSVGEIGLPLVSNDGAAEATLYLLHPRSGLTQILAALNWRIFTITAIGLLTAIVLSFWLTRSIARPLYVLASTANNLSLEKLNTRFEVNGNDEVGVLSEALSSMLKRLRLSRMRLAAAEKKAAQAELSRQINHDIKNGFIPIRNVMQHWQEAATNDKENLAKVFQERKSTVLDSLAYLETLARNYSRMSPEISLSAVNVNQVVENLLQCYHDVGDEKFQLQTDLDLSEPMVEADETHLRRAFENILQNAIEALNGDGKISVITKIEGDRVSILWQDNGTGISEEVRQQLFTSQVTTKQQGVGLGLANVKRIIDDFGGDVTVESQPGRGTLVRITLPGIKQKTESPTDLSK